MITANSTIKRYGNRPIDDDSVLITFKISSSLPVDAKDVLLMFLFNWLSNTSEEGYYLVDVSVVDDNSYLQLRFKDPKDVVIIKLKGIPEDLSKYVEFCH